MFQIDTRWPFLHRVHPSYNRPMLEGHLTTKEAAIRLGMKEQAIRDLIKRGRIKAKRFGSAWAIPEDEIDNFKPGKPGRPRTKRKYTKRT